MKTLNRKKSFILSLVLVVALTFGLFPQIPVTAETTSTISSGQDLEKIRNNPSGDFVLTDDIVLTGEFTPIGTFSGTLNGNGHRISGLTITANVNQPKAAFIVDNLGTIEKLGFVNVSITGLGTNSTYWAGGIAGTNRGIIRECYVTGSVTGAYRSAGIVVTNRSTVANCYSTATVRAKYECGSLVAVSEATSVIDSSYAIPNVYSEMNNTGGIIAYGYTGAVIKNNALLAGTVANGSNSNIARIMGRLNGTPTFQNNVASENALVQGVVVSGGQLNNNQGLSVTNAVLATQAQYMEALGWDFSTTWKMSAALGRPILRNVPEVAATEIRTASDFNLIRNNPAGDFILKTDIALSGEFTPISTFSGTLDGNGHVISGLTITANASQPKAAFIVDHSGTIEKLGFVNVAITGLSTNSTYWAGGIAGTNRGVIRECYVTGSVTGGYRSAGLVVTNRNILADSYSTATVSAQYECGSLVAVSEATSVIDSCYAIPAVYSEMNNTGGITAYGYTGAVIKNNALFSGTVANGSNSNIARIMGRLNGTPTFQNNIASANALVQGQSVSGGLLDNNQGLTVAQTDLQTLDTFEEDLGWNFYTTWKMSAVLGRPILRNAPEVDATEIWTASNLNLIRSNPSGDFILMADIALSGEFTPISTFSGTLDGNGHIISGLTITANASKPKVAFILQNSGIIERLGFSRVKVAGISDDANCWAGGITATNSGTIRECYVTGSVMGGHRSAGIAVHNQKTVKNCYAIIIAKARAECAGVVAVSESNSVVDSCYAVPNAYSTVYNTGGLVAYGYTGTAVKNNAVLAGTIGNGDNTNLARILGRLSGTPTFQNNIASENALVQGQAVSGGLLNNNQGLSVSDSDLALRSTYEDDLGWDFSSVWEFSTSMGRPALQNLQYISPSDENQFVWAVQRDVSVTLSAGIVHRQMDFMDVNGNLQKANIISVDLSLPQNKIIVGTKNNVIPPTDANGNYIRTVDSEGHDVIKASVDVQASTTKALGQKVIAGVNGEFYTEQGPEGYMIKDGSAIINGVRVPGVDGKDYPFHGFFGIRDDGTAVIGNYGSDWQAEKNNLFQASGGQFWMVKDGVVQDFSDQIISDPNNANYDDQTYYRHKDRHPRTAVGIKADGSVFFVVVDGRGANGSVGVYIEELGKYMKELGAYQALNMDGGGSSTAVTFNSALSTYEIKNTPINKVDGVNTPGVPRDVFSSLLILAE